jgi:Cof subfamily protein (haloacid dehalogenase superfamily)
MIDIIQAVAADIDMTLTSKGDPLPEPTVKAFKILHEKKVLLGLATGREIDEKLKKTGENWGLGFEFDFIVGMNGGMVYNRHADSMYTIELMTIEEMTAILTYMMPWIDKYKVSINAEGGGNHNAMYIGKEILDAGKRHGFYFIDKTGDIKGFCEKRAYKILFRAAPEYGELIRSEFLKKFGENYQIIETYPGTVEVMHKGIDKGNGLLRYTKEVGIDIKNVISFGDNENDDTLLEMSGWGVCLRDGNENTKKCADALTDYDCADGGVGHYLLDHCMNAKLGVH